MNYGVIVEHLACFREEERHSLQVNLRNIFTGILDHQLEMVGVMISAAIGVGVDVP